eukprot:scaffold15698_cov154-Skeletonema_marinoi.AAC.6
MTKTCYYATASKIVKMTATTTGGARRRRSSEVVAAAEKESYPAAVDDSSCSDSTASSTDEKQSLSQMPHQPRRSLSLQSISQSLLPWLGLSVWPCMLALPLFLNTQKFHYSTTFPRGWWTLRGEHWLDKSLEEGGIWEYGTEMYGKTLRHPLGLSLGISAVAVGHVFLLIYFRLHQQQYLGKTTSIQSRGAVQYVYADALKNHLCQPGGFLLLGLYLTITWVFDLLPHSYYSFSGGIQYKQVAMCLVCQDFVQFLMHKVEHVAHPKMYKISHKPHHKFTNPKLFDAFDGSVPDTAIMILVPLFVTAHVVRDCNVWTYMAFGSSYANWLTLIHSEVAFPWEGVFRKFGLGTSADHHVHHKFFKYNFGHLFMWFDMLTGTYRSPSAVWGKEFNDGV